MASSRSRGSSEMPGLLEDGYQRIHARLYRERGAASGFSCSCGSPAKEWAYQYSAGASEKRSRKGSPYSDDPEDYAPMCTACHQKFDIASDPIQAARRSKANRSVPSEVRARGGYALGKRLREDSEFRDDLIERWKPQQRQGARTYWERFENDPEFRDARRKEFSEAASIRFRCGTCGKETTAGPLGTHQRYKNHEGKERIS